MRKLLIIGLLLFAGSACAQSWQEMAGAKIMNFDKRLVGTDKLIYIQPPEGVTWVILSGSAQTEEPVLGVMFAAWLEDAPYAPYRPNGCDRCQTLINVPADNRNFFPLIGGYSDTIAGKEAPIVVRWPNRMMLAFTPVHGALPQPMNVYVRLRIVEEKY